MDIKITEIGCTTQDIHICDINYDEVNLLKTLIEMIDLQEQYYQVKKQYSFNLNELIAFRKVKNGEI